MSRLARPLAALYWSVFAGALLVAGLFVSWQALAGFDFAYLVWHEVLGIGDTIARYAPENRWRQGFEHTTPIERARLFGAIVDAIHADGRGLADLRYHDPEGRELGRLLRPPEIVHLRDVARLVRWFEIAGIAALALVMALTLEARWRRRSLPPARRFLGVGAALVGGVLIVLLAIGPVEVFYALHELVFPPDHEWFFWYQDSLMATLMQAPNLFGAIAAVWFPFALALAWAGLWAIGRFLERGRSVAAS
ncbi:MAG: DUF1461 domain-containing protein [Halofilum sp. (in: g-proteobacteria)]|nr:DUF1461 domain-containing protein [Halofilum sp. (in: g-proteobacteria)]